MNSSKYSIMPEKAWVLIYFLCLLGCTPDKPKTAKSLVYEGMSKAELTKVLGDPLLIDSSALFFDTEKNKKTTIYRWKYDQRTVVLINDTVRSANEKIN